MWLLTTNICHIFCTVKIICDADHIITNVEAKWPGSVDDSRVYHESNISDFIEQGKQPQGLHYIIHPSSLMHSAASSPHYRRAWWLPPGWRGLPMPASLTDPVPGPRPRPPAELQPGPQQDQSPGGDDHRPAESTFPVPAPPQGHSWEGLRHHRGMCCSP